MQDVVLIVQVYQQQLEDQELDGIVHFQMHSLNQDNSHQGSEKQCELVSF